MNFTTHHGQIRTLKQSDPCFRIIDKFTTCGRAGFEISKQCPREYKLILSECIDRGWIQPVAYITERELLISGLSNEN
jgi:hypothetical protein